MSANNSISARTQRLNKLIVSCLDDSKNAGVANATTILNRETLLDAFNALYNECNKDAVKKGDTNIFEFTKKYREVVNETKKLRVNIGDFRIKCLIGKGFFGEVHLATENITRDVYAIKKIPKASFAQAKEERNIMAISRSDWIPALQYAFQDQKHLYLVMEYLPGGDLFSLMIRNGTFPEDLICFYLSEITLALNAMHTLGFVHRDIKPENILLDRLGHLKLVDFGSAAIIQKDGQVTSFTPVGTPDYIAPELLQPIHSKRPMKTTYNETCDFWSMGIIAYEMLTETTPFHNEIVADTYADILSYNDGPNQLTYPSETEISPDLRDLIARLVTKMGNRLTYKKIIMHPFFKDVDWMNVRQQVPPIIPVLNGDDDTSNFEEDVKKARRNNTFDATPSTTAGNSFSGFDLPFVGYGYVHEENTAAALYPGESKSTEVNRLATQVKSLQKTIDTQMVDISSLQQNLTEYQRKSAQMSSVEKILAVTKEEMHALKEKLKEKTVEIANCRTQIKTLKNSLKIEEEQRAKNDANIADVLNSTYQKWERAKKLSEQNYEKQISEKNSEVMSIKHKLKLREKELESKSAECLSLQETIANFKDRLKSSKSQSDTEKTEFAKKHRESNVHFEGQMREMRTKIQKMTDTKHAADDEIQKLNEIIQENSQKLKLISDQRERLDQTNAELTKQLNREIDENRKLRDERQSHSQQSSELQTRIDELTNDLRKYRRVSTPAESIDGSASVYCSLESLSSEVENQLKKDLVLAKEGENEQRMRANSLEETVKRLEAIIDRVTNQGISGVEEMLERKTEKLEDRLNTVREQAIVDRQASRTAHLALWKLEKQLETVKSEKERLELTLKKTQTEKDELDRRIKENRITVRSREERIAELQSDLTTLKSEIQAERSKWEIVEKERNKEKAQIVNQNTKIHKLEIDLEECKSKMRLYELQKNALAIENKKLTDKLREENKELANAVEMQNEVEQKYEALCKSHEMLKHVCTLMETQLNELEEMYNAQIETNKEKSVTIDKLWSDIRERDAKLLKLEQDLRVEKAHKVTVDQKSSDLCSELTKATESLADCLQQLTTMNEKLAEKTECLLKAEESIDVQKEEIQNLQRVNQAVERELKILKEENSQLLTELFTSKETYNSLQLDYSSLRDRYSDMKQELEQLTNTIAEMQAYHTQRELKWEATQTQFKKLIEVLQAKLPEKKKKTFAEVLFGSSGTSKKENVPPNANQAQNELKRERIRASQQKSLTAKVSKTLSVKKVEKSHQSTTSKEPAREEKRAKPQGIDELHHWYTSCYTSGSDMSAKCICCKVPFANEEVLRQCEKCKTCVHNKCRKGAGEKCTSQSQSGNSDADTISTTPEPSEPEYTGDILLREKDQSPPLKINCLYEIDENVFLLGCSNGLKAFNKDTKKLIHVANIDDISDFAIVPTFPKSILVGANGKQLLQCDLRHLVTRSKATVCLNTGLDYVELDLPFVKGNLHEKWRFVRIFDNFDKVQEISEPIAIAATQMRIVILQYDVKYKCFKAMQSLDTAQPIQSVQFTPYTAIVSSDKFFEIELQSGFGTEEFLDLSDKSILHSLASKPMHSFAINPNEYLMCFEDFGIFVDKHGSRSRPNDIKWLKKPTAFEYRAPILFIASTDGVQMMRIHKSFSNELNDEANDEKPLQTFVNANKVRMLGHSGKYSVVTLASSALSESDGRHLLQIDGTKALRKALCDSIETILSMDSDF